MDKRKKKEIVVVRFSIITISQRFQEMVIGWLLSSEDQKGGHSHNTILEMS